MTVINGSGFGYEYEYHYRFRMDDDIIRRYSRFTIRDDVKFLFEIRTNFRLKSDEMTIDIDSERFEIGAQSCNKTDLYFLICRRFDDYWFSNPEISAFARAASAFAAEIASSQRRRVIPIAVDLDVRTVRAAGESSRDAADRAIRSEKLFPLWLMCDRYAFVNVEKPPYRDLIPFLRGFELYLDRVLCTRFYPECCICMRGPKIGDQYTKLKDYCGHKFHYRCLVVRLLTQTSCPICCHPISPSRHEDLALYEENRLLIDKFLFC